MKKKVIGILVCTMLIMTLLPVVGAVNISTTDVGTEIKYVNNVTNNSFQVDKDKTDLPDGFIINFLGTKGLENLDIEWPPEWDMTFKNQIGIGFYNNGQEVIDADLNISYEGILGMKLRSIEQPDIGFGFIMSPGGGPAHVFYTNQFKRPNTGKKFPGLVKITISGEINGEDLLKIGIFVLFHEKTSLIFEK